MKTLLYLGMIILGFLDIMLEFLLMPGILLYGEQYIESGLTLNSGVFVPGFLFQVGPLVILLVALFGAGSLIVKGIKGWSGILDRHLNSHIGESHKKGTNNKATLLCKTLLEGLKSVK